MTASRSDDKSECVAELHLRQIEIMVTRQRKQEIVAALVEKLKDANGLYFVDVKGMKVSEINRLRNALKPKGVSISVVKNTLLCKAVEEVGISGIPEEQYVGETALAVTYDDALAPAKIIKESVDKNKMPEFKGALVEGQYFAASQLKELAALPSKPDMIASIIGSLNAPVSGIVGSINAVMRDLASVIEEAAKKRA